MALIETVNLGQKYGERDSLKNITLSIEKGEVFALIGPTGSGKTTILRLLDLLDKPTSGKILFAGQDVTTSSKLRFEARRRMAFVLQKPVVFNSRVYDNLAYGLKWRGKKEAEVRKRVADVLAAVGLTPYRNRNARTLSGGETQKVAIARAIAVEPEVLLLDEPTANLDPKATAEIEDLLARIIHKHQSTIVMATHDMAQGQRLASRIGVLLNGELTQTGAPTEIFYAPRNKEIAEFVGVENIIEGRVLANKEGLAAIAIDSSVIEAVTEFTSGTKVRACLRPEDITLSLDRPHSSARNSFGGEIARIVATGPLARIELDCGFPLVALVTKRSVEELALAPGKRVYATFKATAVHVLKE